MIFEINVTWAFVEMFLEESLFVAFPRKSDGKITDLLYNSYKLAR